MTPATPSRLLATPVSTAEIDLAWSSMGTDTTTWKIERSTPNNGSFVQIGALPNTQTAYKDTGLDAGTHYYYRVRGYNGSINGGYSPEADAYTLGDPGEMIAAHEAAGDPHPVYLTAAEHNAILLQALFYVDDVLGTGAGHFRIYNCLGRALTISKVALAVDTVPTGQAIICDIHQDSVTIFTNQTHRPQISAGANTGNTTTIDVASWAADSYLTMDIDQVGSGTPGSNLTVHVVYS